MRVDTEERTLLTAPRPNPEMRLPDLTQPLLASEIAVLSYEVGHPEKALFVLQTWCVQNPKKVKPPPPKEAKGSWSIGVVAVLRHALHTVLDAAERVQRPDVVEQLGRYVQQLADRIVRETQQCITRNILMRALDAGFQWHDKAKGHDYDLEIALSLQMLVTLQSTAQRYIEDAEIPPSPQVQAFYKGMVERLFELFVMARSASKKFTAQERQTVLEVLENLMREMPKNPELPGHEEIGTRLAGLDTIQT